MDPEFAFFDHSGNESDKGLRVHGGNIVAEDLDKGLKNEVGILLESAFS